MREIRFRVWNSVSKYMHDHGWLVAANVFYSALSDPAKYNHVMQFTGLHDKNGKEIWEDDVIRLSYPDETTELFTVVYTDYKARFQLKDRDDCKYGFDKSNRMEVIGNIYQHSHLLKTE